LGRSQLRVRNRAAQERQAQEQRGFQAQLSEVVAARAAADRRVQQLEEEAAALQAQVGLRG
jgi:hypothetical protein